MVDATLLLANSAESLPNGLVYALGLGWSVTRKPTPPSTVVVLIQVPWDEANQRLAVVLELLDADGQAVIAGVNEAGEPAALRLEGQLDVGRPPGLPRGTPLDQAEAIQIAPDLPVHPNSRYMWRLTVNDEPIASKSFFVAG